MLERVTMTRLLLVGITVVVIVVVAAMRWGAPVMPAASSEAADTVAASSSSSSAPAKPRGPLTDADFAAHIEQLREKLPHDRFTVLVQKPFVVVGDESADMVRRRAAATVGWAVDHLKQSYFTRDPDVVLTIWLFKDKASYEKHAEQLFGRKPTTPYGYYSRRNRALVMNIATGGGTLVHEIVHPFVEANFPDCPAWFNEGLGSLYEQSGEREGRIVGFTNWRLSGLQKAIGQGALPTFKDLTGTTTGEFYTKHSGRNYAQARYLLYYLQQRGLLRTFYRRFLADHEKDPTGYETLKAVLELTDAEMPEFERTWRQWVMTLRYPER